jgi:cytochrome c oxidase subunit 3
MVAIGVLLFVIRGFEFNSLNVMWYDNAYGSIIWACCCCTRRTSDRLGRHGRAVAADEDAARRRAAALVDTDENALYWRFVWLSWLPIYC